LAGDADRLGDLGPGCTPVQSAGHGPFKVGLRGGDGRDPPGDLGQRGVFVTFGAFHARQDALTRFRVSGCPDVARSDVVRGDCVEEVPVRGAGVEQDTGAVVTEPAEPEPDTFDPFDQVVR
jgi:hypothetical protein